MSAEAPVYLDSSALVKLVVAEPESEALVAHLRDCPLRVSCALARVEVVRAVSPHGATATRRARQLLERISLLRLDDVLLDTASSLEGETFRTLDAIHVAAAQTLGSGLAGLITYDHRMAAAAHSLDLAVSSPA
jgi:predicted nucleic acid-binding protein